MTLLHLMIILAVLGLAAVPALTTLERLALDRAAAESVEIAAVGLDRPERVTIGEQLGGGVVLVSPALSASTE
ncbi:MAG: hypothetical protein KDK05_24445 [Candidatus Competibacteraceae bacterium]|nr:hypothetical protein [Candidatus Competibacteraceae bacterium]